MRPWAICLILPLAGIGMPIHAGMETSGTARMIFSTHLQSIPEHIDDFDDRYTVRAESYMSTSASNFASSGVLVWIGFPCKVSNQARSCTLTLDLDTSGWSKAISSPLQPASIKIHYLETIGKDVLYEGRLHTGSVWINDLALHDAFHPVIDGAFEIILADPQGVYPGARAFLEGRFSTNPKPPAPTPVDNDDPYHPHYTEVGCMGATSYHSEPYQEDGCDCGGSDYESDDGGWDDGADSGCEGDTTDDGWDDDTDNGCEGDTSNDHPEDNSCSHIKVTPSKPSKPTGGELTRSINRMLPLLAAVFLICRRRAIMLRSKKSGQTTHTL